MKESTGRALRPGLWVVIEKYSNRQVANENNNRPVANENYSNRPKIAQPKNRPVANEKYSNRLVAN
jgi:hypothetical protein